MLLSRARSQKLTRREDRDLPCVGSDALLRTNEHRTSTDPRTHLMDHEYIAVGPLLPLGLLAANPERRQ